MEHWEDDDQEQGAPAWVVTFGDMMSLLLTFFVLLLSFSEIDRVAFAQIMGSLKDAFGVQQVQVLTNPMNAPEKKPVAQEGNAAGEGLLDKLNALLPGAFAGGNEGLSDGEGAGRVSISFPGRLLFETGDASINPAFYGTLDKIAGFMKSETDLTLQIFGHTDDRPINTVRYLDNWELSSSRAISVIRYLVDSGVERERLVPVGLADTRPVAPNDSPDNREKNRRVEFLFIEGSEPGDYQVQSAQGALEYQQAQ